MVALALLAPAAAMGAGLPGELDPTFGGGRVTPPLGPGNGAAGVALQPDGKVLIAASSETTAGFSIARLLQNGSPDPDWGGDGNVTTPLGEFAGAFDVAVQPDGKVVAVGQAPGTENDGFRGTASDPDGEGLRRVQVALVRIRPHRAGASGSPKPRHWRTVRGKGTWSYKLPNRSPQDATWFSRARRTNRD